MDSLLKNSYVKLFLFGVIILTCGSCASEVMKSTTADDLVIYPPPPNITRVQYLTSISSSSDITEKQPSFKKFIYGEEEPKPLVKPYGVTVNGSTIYICDTGIGGLVIMDLANNSFEYFTPGGRGQLQLPLNCALDNDGFLYVADGNRRQVVIFNKEGRYYSEIGEQSESFKPTDVVIREGLIYVVSVKDQKVFVYDKSSGSLKFSFPETESGDEGFLYQPTNLFVNDSGIFVSDMGDNTIKMFSLEGVYIKTVGGPGDSPGKLMRPKGLTVDNQNNIFIVDAAFENVQIFNEEGQILMYFGGPYNGHGDMWLPADVTVSYSGLDYFSKYVDASFNLKYLIFVTNQYGPDKISVYGFVEPKNGQLGREQN